MAVIAVLVIISILIVEVEGGNHGRSGSNIGSNSNSSSNTSGCYSSVSHHINTNSGSGRRKSW